MIETHFYVESAASLLGRFRPDCESRPVEKSLWACLSRAASLLEATYRELTSMAADRRSASVKWLLDNQRVIREQVRLARRDLRSGYERRLPGFDGAAKGSVPKIYRLAQDAVDRGYPELNADFVREFVNSYQRTEYLTLAELWAFPAMLRLALIEELGKSAGHVALQRSRPHERTLDGEIDGDGARRGEDRATVGQTITSLRKLGLIDWKKFVESTSIVERTLRKDPDGIYGRMTFESRSHYHNAVVRLARRSRMTEEQVAESAVVCAQAAAASDAQSTQCSDALPSARQRHVGYYLLDRGRPALEERVEYRPSWMETIQKALAGYASGWYIGGFFFMWLMSTGIAASVAWRLGVVATAGPVACLALLLLAAGSMGHLAVTVVDWVSSLLVTPKPMMRMDFTAGIPQDCRTLVAIPTMLTGEQGVLSLLHQLEVRFLANQDENLSFALVSDFSDADRETLPGDSSILGVARQGIERLNVRYHNAFYLLHRPRVWNASEGAWMGSERKRGKLSALNRLLQSGDRSPFRVTVGDLSRLASVRYVITLDTDTRLPRDVAREMVGCMAHPLNRPQLDARTHIIKEGHAVLQPRVATTLVDAQRSLFSRLLSGDAGIDPYTRLTSQVYQDVFDEGSFIGKGIYDVRAWETALEGRFPENRVLSHDLIEGCFARSGYVGDVELFESIPAAVLADASRRHRWIRGDWQIATWLFRSVPTAQGRSENPLPWLSRWKIADNLRRSLTPIFLFLLMVLGWTLSPSLAVFWTLLAATIMFGPAVIIAGLCFLRKIEDKPWKLHFIDEVRMCLRAVAVEFLSWSTLPYVAHYHLDAIVRALYRLYVSQRRLLEWTTASDAEARSQTGCQDYYERMWVCTISSLGLATYLLITAPVALRGAGPALLIWLLAPLVAWRISQPSRDKSPGLTDEERMHVGRWARQTWHYFETTVNGKTHWLPPDNRQEGLPPVVVARTSPTNIGMGLLANLAACDLGYIPPSAMLDRSARALHSMLHLQQHRGHFFNWYDTSTLQPAEPRYVSTVDSGNLWAALIVLHAGAEEMRDRPLVPPRLIDGVRDTLAAIGSVSEPLRRSPSGQRFAECYLAFQALAERTVGGKARDTYRSVRLLHSRAKEMAAAVPEGRLDVRDWAQTMVRQCAAAQRDLGHLAFWTRIPQIGSRQGEFFRRVADSFPDGWQKELIKGISAAIEEMDDHCRLSQLSTGARRIAKHADILLWPGTNRVRPNGCFPQKLDTVLLRISRGARRAAAIADAELQQIARVQDLCRQFCAMDFRFLYDAQRKLLAIGYDATNHRRDESYYDLLASEARMTSFLAVSHGQLPLEHWFALGRIVTLAAGKPALVSWSGSMFEHLMPTLIMPSYRGTFLDASCRVALRRQIDYARSRGIPWGISESCYNAAIEDAAYAYRAFGVPGLGLERDLAENLVVAPYASALAMPIAPREAIENLIELERRGYLSPCGFYDAIDYTPGRDLAGQPAACRIVMAHHSGMTLLAMGDALLGRVMERRFIRDRQCEAHDLLLQERVPKAIRPVDLEMTDVSVPSPETRARVKDGKSTAQLPAAPNSSQPAPSLPRGYGIGGLNRQSPARISESD